MTAGHFRNNFTLEVPSEMDKLKDNEEYRCELPNYSELIIEMVRNTSDTWILEQIYRYTKNMTKEG